MAKFTNIRTVSVPSIGKLPLAANPGTFTPSGVKRDHKAGRLPEDGGYTESGQPAKLELNLNMLPGISVDDINAIESEDVTVRLSDGSVYMLPQAFVADPLSVNDGESKLTIIANTSEKI
jgi:hypothetical protein